jgi:hypothetical protein
VCIKEGEEEEEEEEIVIEEIVRAGERTKESSTATASLTNEWAANFLTRAIALYLLAFGFECAEQSVLEILCEVVGAYISNLGRLLRLECDATGLTTTVTTTTTSSLPLLNTSHLMIELLDRVVAEVCLYGLDGLKEFLADDLIRLKNKLRLVPEHSIERYLNFAKEAKQRRLATETLQESNVTNSFTSSLSSSNKLHGITHYRTHARHIPFARKLHLAVLQNPRHFLYHHYQLQLQYQQQQLIQQQQQFLLLQQQQQVLQQLHQQQQQQQQQTQQHQQQHQHPQQQHHHQQQQQQMTQGASLLPSSESSVLDPSRVKIKTESNVSLTQSSHEPMG